MAWSCESSLRISSSRLISRSSSGGLRGLLHTAVGLGQGRLGWVGWLGTGGSVQHVVWHAQGGGAQGRRVGQHATQADDLATGKQTVKYTAAAAQDLSLPGGTVDSHRTCQAQQN